MPVLGWSWRWLIWPCIHASMHPSAVLLTAVHATHCPSCGEWALNSTAEWALTQGTGSHQKAFPRDLTVNRSHAKHQGPPPGPRTAGCVCVCLSVRDHLREPRASHKWKMSGEATKGRGASLGLKTPREVQGTRHSRPQRCTAFIWDIHSCWVRGSPGAMAQFATRSLVVRTLWRSERHKSVPLNGRPRAAAWVHLTYPGD